MAVTLPRQDGFHPPSRTCTGRSMRPFRGISHVQTFSFALTTDVSSPREIPPIRKRAGHHDTALIDNGGVGTGLP